MITQVPDAIKQLFKTVKSITISTDYSNFKGTVDKQYKEGFIDHLNTAKVWQKIGLDFKELRVTDKQFIGEIHDIDVDCLCKLFIDNELFFRIVCASMISDFEPVEEAGNFKFHF